MGKGGGEFEIPSGKGKARRNSEYPAGRAKPYGIWNILREGQGPRADSLLRENRVGAIEES